ncbi:MAG: metalloregulator ArsR/SmtB family transcription factor [Chromatiaceae bacterium]|jgi:DNA-binding transcriptional ArsR family regulator|nr:metalloregulator ArsR/SmtB family transcription factor [Chromatiaceae bacterium]
MDEIKGLSEVFKLLGEPNRLRILLSLGLECRPVSAVIAATGLSQTNVSFHLRTLREAGLVRGEPNGPFVFYCLADPELLTLIEQVRHWQSGRVESAEENGATSSRAGRSAAPRRRQRASG